MAKGRQRQPAQAAATSPSAGRIERAWRLFDEGDKVLARREAKAVLAEDPGGPWAEQAREILFRTSIPAVAWLTGGAAALLAVVLILLAIART